VWLVKNVHKSDRFVIWKAKRKEPKGNKKNTENVNEKKKQISKKSLASSRGLVVKAEDSGLKGRGLKPPP
jgi:hypothetical protein